VRVKGWGSAKNVRLKELKGVKAIEDVEGRLSAEVAERIETQRR
jgi:hypothetical protein